MERKTRNTSKILVALFKRWSHFEDLDIDNTKVDLKQMIDESVERIHVDQDVVQRWASLNTVMNLQSS
jgi:hypothetical protein